MPIGLAADGSRLWAGPPRRMASLSLRLPGNAPQGRVSSASAHAGPARRTAALDGFQKSPSLRRGRRAGPLAPGRRAPSYDAPQGRVSSASAQPALTCPGSRCLGNRLAPCRQDMDSVARNHLAACGGGEPLLSRSRQKGRDACCVPAQVLSPRARSGSRAPCAQAPRTPSSPSLSRAA